MNILIVGSSSEIAIKLIEKLKRYKNIKLYTISRKKNSFKGHFLIKNYEEKNLNNFKKKVAQIKFDRTIFFNGYQKFSILSLINIKLLNKIFKINFIIPLQIWSFLFKNEMLKSKSLNIFVSSIAAELTEVGNAYYSLAKSLINRSVCILNNEQKKRHSFLVVSLGLVKNKMSKKMINNFPGNFKNVNSFVDNQEIMNSFIKIIFSKKLNKSIIKIHGKYKN